MTFFRRPSTKRPLALFLLVALVLPLLVGGGLAAPRPADAVIPLLAYAGYVAGAAIISAGIAYTAAPSIAAYISNLTKAGFTALITFVIDLLTLLANSILTFVAAFLFKVASYNNFTHNETVEVGWVAVRDFANLFFVFILLAIAIASIMGSEKLHYKQHLVKLLMMALLINFSKMISGIFIDFSQVLTLTFLKVFADAGPTGLLAMFGHFNQGTLLSEAWSGDAPPVDLLGVILASVTDLLFSAVAVVVISIMVALFAVRIVALWILVILSPLAFLLSTFPQGQQYAGRWWSEMGKNLSNGPVLAFFLWLALASNVGTNIFFPQGGLEGTPTRSEYQAILQREYGEVQNIGSSGRGAASQVAQTIITIAFLMAGLKFASEIGGAGSGAASAGFGFLRARGVDALKAGDRFIARGGIGKLAGGERTALGRTIGKYSRYLSPTVVGKGWAGRTERLEKKAYLPAAGDIEDLLNKRFNIRLGTTGGARTLASLLGKTAFGKTEVGRRMVGKLAAVRAAGLDTFEGKIARGQLYAEEAKRYKEARLTADQIANYRIEAHEQFDVGGLEMVIVEQNLQDNVTATARTKLKRIQEAGGEVPDELLQLAVGVSREQRYTRADVQEQQQRADAARAAGKPPPPVWKEGDKKVNLDTLYRSWQQDPELTQILIQNAGLTQEQMQRLKMQVEAGYEDFQVEDFRRKKKSDTTLSPDASKETVKKKMREEHVPIRTIQFPQSLVDNAPVTAPPEQQTTWGKLLGMVRKPEAPKPQEPQAPGAAPVPPTPTTGAPPRATPEEGGGAAGGVAVPEKPKDDKGGGAAAAEERKEKEGKGEGTPPAVESPELVAAINNLVKSLEKGARGAQPPPLANQLQPILNKFVSAMEKAQGKTLGRLEGIAGSMERAAKAQRKVADALAKFKAKYTPPPHGEPPRPPEPPPPHPPPPPQPPPPA